MTGGWSIEAQRYLDGEGPPPTDADERARADAFLAATRGYATWLRVPGPQIDQAVIEAVGRSGGQAVRRSVWRWLVESRLVVRPAVAAAAVLALIAMSVGLTLLTRPPNRPTAQPPVEGGRGAGTGTVLVRFELDAPGARTVALAGSFNGWSDSAITFSRSPETGRWTVTVALPPGEHQYLFVVDGERWVQDPAAHAQVRDEFGQTNSVLVVGPRGVVRS
jgi:hypothetical protein